MSNKYIIEIPDGVPYVLLRREDFGITKVVPVVDLEELTIDYIKENCKSLLNEFYQKGFEDGKNSIKNGCVGCKYEDQHGYDEPCNKCLHAHANHYTPMPKQDDSIKVGDEVTHKSDSVVWKAVCIRIDGDGRHMNLMGHTGAVGYYPVDDFKKTGRHFSISEILEAMRK